MSGGVSTGRARHREIRDLVQRWHDWIDADAPEEEGPAPVLLVMAIHTLLNDLDAIDQGKLAAIDRLNDAATVNDLRALVGRLERKLQRSESRQKTYWRSRYEGQLRIKRAVQKKFDEALRIGVAAEDRATAAEARVERLEEALREIGEKATRQNIDWMHFHEDAMRDPFHAEALAQEYAASVAQAVSVLLHPEEEGK